MAQEQINVPNIGDSRDVDVVEVLVKPGARLEREQTMIVLESEKASMDVPAPRGGLVREVKVKVGDKVSEGSAILVLELEEAGEAAAAPQPSAAEGKGNANAQPAAGSGKAGAPGAQPSAAGGGAGSRAEQPAEEAGPQPAAAEARARPERSGSQEEPPPAKPTNGAPSEGPRRTAPPAPPVSASPPPTERSSLPYASPAVRRFARELGVDLTRVTGTARGGRITKEDVQGHVKQALNAPSEKLGALSIGEAPEIDFSQFGEISDQPLTKIQKLTGRNLSRAWVTIPHVTQFDEADITELEEFRKKVRASQPDLKLTLVTFFMKALVSAMRAMPRFNASLDKSGEKLILKHYFHIGVAVDTPNGLVVPVIRDVDRKGLAQLAKELEEVSERARARRLTPSDMQGASMTISSLGGIGGTAFTPIINPPEVAILGVSRARQAPVFQNGEFVPRLICPLSLSYDHRVIDGADGARFTSRLREALSDIRQLLL